MKRLFEGYYTTKELAEVSGYAEGTLRNRRLHKLPPLKWKHVHSKFVIYPVSEVERFLTQLVAKKEKRV